MKIDFHNHLFDKPKEMPKGYDIIVVGYNHEANKKIVEQYSSFVYFLGIAPQTLHHEGWNEEWFDYIANNIKYGIGEVGLDYKYGKTTEEKERQRQLFERFLELAEEKNLPVMIHSRLAEKDCYEILTSYAIEKAIFHFFSGSFSLAKKIVERGWYVSFPAKPNETREKIIKELPDENILLETDYPYVMDFPSGIDEAYSYFASIKGISVEEVEKIMERNFESLFGDLLGD